MPARPPMPGQNFGSGGHPQTRQPAPMYNQSYAYQSSGVNVRPEAQMSHQPSQHPQNRAPVPYEQYAQPQSYGTGSVSDRPQVLFNNVA